MELLASYGKRTARDSVALAAIVSKDTIACNGKLVNLRTGATGGVAGAIAWSRAGHALIVHEGSAAVRHPDGRKVPLAVEGTGMLEPLFVGSGLLMQDDPMRERGLAVFDVESGALRGRLEHERKVFGPRQMVSVAMFDVGDDRHVWLTDVSRLRLWDLQTVECTRVVPLPEGFEALGVGAFPSGAVVAGIRPKGDFTPERAELAVFEGTALTRRRPAALGPWSVSGGRIVARPWQRNELVTIDEALETVATLPIEATIDPTRVLPLWSGLDEVLVVGGFNQVHHFGDPSLKLAVASSPEPKKAAKPTKKKAR